MPAQDEAKAIEVELNWRYQHGDQTAELKNSGLACDGILPPAAVSTQVYNGAPNRRSWRDWDAVEVQRFFPKDWAGLHRSGSLPTAPDEADRDRRKK